ncbi:MAG TPA: ABC transporter permease [Polyangiaceae bacterium]|nr:ABC transporter permease [Polyangiaceae bacterium]
MTTSASPEAFEDVAAPSRTYGGMVWAELRKKPVAMFGLRCITGLFLLATFAPLVALDQPILWNGGEGWRFPLFSALFNRLLFENSVDVFFNLIFVLFPVYVLLYRVFRKRGRSVLEAAGRLAALHAVVFTLTAPERFGSLENPLHQSRAVVDYRALSAERAAAGHPATAVFPLVPRSYRATNPAESVQAPSREHWLGTDTEGRDVFARMLYGTRISLTIGVVAVAIYVGIGVALGAVAGYFGGFVDSVVSRAIEVMICFPSFFLILTLAAMVQQRSIFHVMAIIGITSWTGVARLVRAEFLKHKALEYAQAALALGLSRPRIIFRHILPNAMGPVLVTATFGIASAILIESSLSFLGIGDVTAASWGETLNTGRLEGKLWLIAAPGFAIFFVVTVFNLVGEGLQDALDPKQKS